MMAYMKFPNKPVMQLNAKSEARVRTAVYANKKMPVKIADPPIVQVRPNFVCTRREADIGPTTLTADAIQYVRYVAEIEPFDVKRWAR